MKGFFVPFICSITKHQTLITSSHFFFSLLFMYSKSNIGILCLNIDYNIALISVKTDFFTCKSNFPTNFSCNFFKVDLILRNAHFSEKNNLLKNNTIKNIILKMLLTIPVLVAVSRATLQLGSILMHASRIPSEI